MILAVVNGSRVVASPGLSGTCPNCSGQVVAKCGMIKAWHWAHLRSECDSWCEGETEWHYWWKSQVLNVNKSCVEVTMEDGVNKHRADIRLPSGLVVELQHSSIAPDEIQEREWFYKKMIWLFDLREQHRKKRLSFRKKEGFHTFQWKQAKTSLVYVRQQLFFDIGDRVFEVKKLGYKTRLFGWGTMYSREQFRSRLLADIVNSTIESLF